MVLKLFNVFNAKKDIMRGNVSFVAVQFLKKNWSSLIRERPASNYVIFLVSTTWCTIIFICSRF